MAYGGPAGSARSASSGDVVLAGTASQQQAYSPQGTPNPSLPIDSAPTSSYGPTGNYSPQDSPVGSVVAAAAAAAAASNGQVPGFTFTQEQVACVCEVRLYVLFAFFCANNIGFFFAFFWINYIFGLDCAGNFTRTRARKHGRNDI